MPRRDIDFCAGEYYHIYNRGSNRQPIFYERENYLFFLRRMREFVVSVLDIVAYCLMPTHYHYLAKVREMVDLFECNGTSEAVSRAMMKLSVSYTKAINKRLERTGSLFQGQFQVRHVDRDEYLVQLSRYIHLNPVTAGLVAQPEDWECSSYREYVGLRDGTMPVPDVVLSQFVSRQEYGEFVLAYLSGKEDLIGHLLLD